MGYKFQPQNLWSRKPALLESVVQQFSTLRLSPLNDFLQHAKVLKSFDKRTDDSIEYFVHFFPYLTSFEDPQGNWITAGGIFLLSVVTYHTDIAIEVWEEAKEV